MTDYNWNLPWSGGCRCDRVRFRVDQAPLLTAACHCKGCQRMTAGAYSLTATVPVAGFHIEKGETVLGGLQQEAEHHFCEFCKSWLFTKPPGLEHALNLRASMLDDASWFRPFVQVCTDEAIPGCLLSTPRSYPNIPPMEEWAKASAEFAQSHGAAKVTLETVFGHICCRDLEVSRAWYEKLFGREADARPMDGLAEWHHPPTTGLQLFQAPEHAGHSHVTMAFKNLKAERARLQGQGVEVADIDQQESFDIMILRDPDGNMVVLTQPR